MATSGQFQKQYASTPARTYLTTNLAQRRPAPRPKPTPQPTPELGVQAKGDRDYNSPPRWPNLTWNPQRYGVQPKLTVGAPNDQYEQEADRVADQVMSTPDAATQAPIQREAAPEAEELQTKPLAAAITPLVQREMAPEEKEVQAKREPDLQREEMPEEEEIQTKPIASIQREERPEEEEVQTKPLGGSIQREAMPEEEELQAKPLGNGTLQREAMPEEEEAVQMKGAPDAAMPAGSNLESRLSSSQGGGSPLPDEVRTFMEPRFGADFSQVRVHTGSDAVQMNQELNAQAFAHKQDIYFGAGKAPANNALTAHELTHVVQQTGDGQAAHHARASLIQRDIPASMPSPQVSIPPSTTNSTAKSPVPPNGQVVVFEGMQLAPDAKFLRSQLEQMVVQKGEAATDAFAYRFINMTVEQKIKLQLSGYDPKLVDEIKTYLKEEILRLEYDNKEFIKQFEKKALDVTREILNNSEKQIKKELEHYGITSHEIQFGENSTTIYSMSNKEAGKGLQDAASELAKSRREVNKSGLKSIKSREEVENISKNNPFLIPNSLIEKVEQERTDWLNQEDTYHKLCMEKQAVFPVLASYSTGNDAAQRLEQLAKTPPSQLGQSIGKIAQEKLANIETVRGELGSRYSIWKQPYITNITKKQMNAGSMQSRVISDAAEKINEAEASSKMLFAAVAIGLGLLAAIPTGGSSVIAGVAATAAIVGAGVSAYGAYEHLREYSLENAANGTDFDKAKAISQDEPTMLWLALDIVTAGLDIYGAATAFKQLNVLVREAIVAREAKAIRSLMQKAEGIKPGLSDKIIKDARLESDAAKIGKATDPEYGLVMYDIKTEGEAMSAYKNGIEYSPKREVGVFRDPKTGEYVVVQGDQTTVPITTWARHPENMRNGREVRWQLVRHYHPYLSPRSRIPSPADFDALMRHIATDKEGVKDLVSFIEWQHPITGKMETTRFGFIAKNKSFFVEYLDEAGNLQKRTFDMGSNWMPEGYGEFIKSISGTVK